jgi:protein tyrosine phosphatase
MAPGGNHLNQTFYFPCLLYEEGTRCANADFIGLLNSRLGLLHGAAGVGVIGMFLELHQILHYLDSQVEPSSLFVRIFIGKTGYILSEY